MKYTVIVQTPTVNQWEYEVVASSQEEAEQKIRKALEGDGELPDAVSFEQGIEEFGAEMFVADSYESE
jgi:hypothetical protein